jgi:hypothetical protein
MRALKMAKSAPGGAVFGAGGLDRVSELRERDLGSAHEGRSVVGLAAQESADLVGPERGGTSFAVGRRRSMLLVVRGRRD